MPVNLDEYFMQHALREAQEAFYEGEIPIGAVVVIDNKIISKGHNQVERLRDATAHAEILAITAACNALGAKYLPDASLYITIEPCHMCAGAIYWSKLTKIIYGAPDVKQGFRSFFGSKNPFHPKATCIAGLLSDECAQLMKDFFKARR